MPAPELMRLDVESREPPKRLQIRFVERAGGLGLLGNAPP